ncbi:hypothetical protein NPIL_681621 [Nephila pilipes]|uniref:Uncharacterized protein n=1 Tax=Nephila pilipes TaxID=299642 RepID=A0A8X6MWF9_NEPPI|nr:hypothetical protein NPIL_681621 [Nephila pilipes]
MLATAAVAVLPLRVLPPGQAQMVRRAAAAAWRQCGMSVCAAWRSGALAQRTYARAYKSGGGSKWRFAAAILSSKHFQLILSDTEEEALLLDRFFDCLGHGL